MPNDNIPAPPSDKATLIREIVNKLIDDADGNITFYGPPSIDLIRPYVNDRVALVACLKSLDDRPPTPWKTPG